MKNNFFRTGRPHGRSSSRALQLGRYVAATALLTATTAVAAEEAWVAKPAYDPFTGSSRCVAESVHRTMHDGYQDTAIYLQVDQKQLLIVTESNIDLGAGDAELKVDDRASIKFEQVKREVQAIVEREIARVLADFREGLKVTITLKFWPTWPSKGSKRIDFSLIGFRKAFAALPAC
jgi:hypothetical protein